MAVSINVCNLALSELRAPPIAMIDEASIEARECARNYPHCLKLLLEAHDWSFGTRIEPLALLMASPRPREWAYAYAMPAGAAQAKRIVPPFIGGYGAVGYFYPWPFDWPRPLTWLYTFIVEAGVLYCNVDQASLEYSADDIDENAMPAMFQEALAMALAARMAVPLRDSREMKGELIRQAEIAKQRAMADDINRQPNREAFDEVAWARA